MENHEMKITDTLLDPEQAAILAKIDTFFPAHSRDEALWDSAHSRDEALWDSIFYDTHDESDALGDEGIADALARHRALAARCGVDPEDLWDALNAWARARDAAEELKAKCADERNAEYVQRYEELEAEYADWAWR